MNEYEYEYFVPPEMLAAAEAFEAKATADDDIINYYDDFDVDLANLSDSE